MPDYSQIKVYLISSIVGGEKSYVYVGATTKPYLISRLAEHITALLEWKKKRIYYIF